VRFFFSLEILAGDPVVQKQLAISNQNAQLLLVLFVEQACFDALRWYVLLLYDDQ
jgi:hypothetical protein